MPQHPTLGPGLSQKAISYPAQAGFFFERRGEPVDVQRAGRVYKDRVMLRNKFHS